MLLDIEDIQVRTVIRRTPGKVRFTLEYPNNEKFRRRVMMALSDLLRPEPLAGEDTDPKEGNPNE